MITSELHSKGERTRQRLIEATIESVAKNGFEFSSVTTISKISKVNRGLVVHYFSTMDRLLGEASATVVDYVIRYSTEFMNSHTEIVDPVERYFSSTFGWIRERPHYGQFLLLMISRSHYEKKSKGPVDMIFSSGRTRVEKLIQMGMASGLYRPGEAPTLAYQVHTMMVGHLVIYLHDTTELERSYRSAVQSAAQLLK